MPLLQQAINILSELCTASKRPSLSPISVDFKVSMYTLTCSTPLENDMVLPTHSYNFQTAGRKLKVMHLKMIDPCSIEKVLAEAEEDPVPESRKPESAHTVLRTQKETTGSGKELPHWAIGYRTDNDSSGKQRLIPIRPDYPSLELKQPGLSASEIRTPTMVALMILLFIALVVLFFAHLLFHWSWREASPSQHVMLLRSFYH